jgi:hypothetical protein
VQSDQPRATTIPPHPAHFPSMDAAAICSCASFSFVNHPLAQRVVCFAIGVAAASPTLSDVNAVPPHRPGADDHCTGSSSQK